MIYTVAVRHVLLLSVLFVFIARAFIAGFLVEGDAFSLKRGNKKEGISILRQEALHRSEKKEEKKGRKIL